MTLAAGRMYGDIKVLAGTSTPEVAQEIADYLSHSLKRNITLTKRQIKKFANDNTFVRLGESVRGQDVYIIQTMSRPVNDNLMELLITLDAARRDSAGRITAVIPHMSYTRTDKKDLPRTPITARLIADMIEVAGADRYMTIDLHAGQIQGFFRIPGDVLTSFHLLARYVKENIPLDNLIVSTADLGFAKGGRNWARELKLPLALIEKNRTEEGVAAKSVVGSVEGKDVLLVDDEIDTAGSILEAVSLLKREGAREVSIAFTHAVFSPPALERIAQLQDVVRKIIFTNTLPHKAEDMLPNMEMLSVGPMLGEVIRRAHLGLSVGEMFNE
jgi:ribose-phosphate pyrophosphokinase